MEIKDHNTLNNYVKRLKDKNAIVQTKNGYGLSPLLRKEQVQINVIPV